MSNKAVVLQIMLSGLLCFASCSSIHWKLCWSSATYPNPDFISWKLLQNWKKQTETWFWIPAEPEHSRSLAVLVFFNKFDFLCFRDSWTMACAIAKWNVLPLYLSYFLKGAQQYAVRILSFENHRSACCIFYMETICNLIGSILGLISIFNLQFSLHF